MMQTLGEFLSPEAGQARRKWLDESLGQFIPPELRGWVGAGAELNPVTNMERASIGAKRVADPSLSGWDRMAAAGDTAVNMASVLAPVAGAKLAGTKGADAIVEALTAASPMKGAVDDFMVDEFGGVRVWTGGVGDPMKAASDRGAWFAETPDLAKEYAGQGGRVLSAEIDPRNPIMFRHAEQRRPIGDVISTALEGAGEGANFEAARPIVERLSQRYGSEPRALFEYWNNDKDVADLFRALGYDAISAAEKADMKAATWAALDPSIVKMDAANPATLGFRAYHGSPHDFDRFSLDKIGTGEGAQAYGHGLYFAESEGVARSYRDSLARPYYAMEDGSDVAQKYGADVVDAFESVGGDPAEIADTIYRLRQMVARDLQEFGVSSVSELRPQYDGDLASTVINAARRADGLEALLKSDGVKRVNEGRMYEVQINADPADFLDWDKPFTSADDVERFAARFDAVDPALRKRIEDFGYVRQQMGQPMPDGNDIIREVMGGIGSKDAARASETMREAGIPGIRYLDAGSRGAGDGSRNYVVFDDKLIEILRKYGLAGAVPMGALLSQPQDPMGSYLEAQ